MIILLYITVLAIEFGYSKFEIVMSSIIKVVEFYKIDIFSHRIVDSNLYISNNINEIRIVTGFKKT